MSSTTDGLQGKQKLDSLLASKDAITPRTIICSVSNILDFPNEILIKIILLLNARERVGLGNSCKRFHSLVFEDEELLRNLDFSKNGHFTLASEVQKYFNNENCCDKILGINIRNTRCIKPGFMLNDSIGRARNLVDINVHGLEFKDIWQFGSFLNPLPHVKRLSFDWSEASEGHISMCCKVLQEPFSRLKYLSVDMKVMDCVKVFIPSLRLCQELEELHIVVKTSSQTSYSDNWSGEPKELRNLEVVEYYGPLAMEIKQRFGALLPNPDKWADFQMDSFSDAKGFYLALVDVCEELAASKWIERIPNITAGNRSNVGWALIPEFLLKEVLGITHENVPEERCCLSTYMDKQRCLLKIEEAKKLLKNPRSEISYLYMNHPTDLGCDVHLVASAFTNLTELQLAAVTRNLQSYPMDSHFQRRLKRRGEAVPEKLDGALNMDSSFKMLVKNTPHLRHFTLGGCGIYKNWDLEELRLISRWKFLQSLRLLEIPIEDGDFLTEIGKECTNLQNLELIRLGLQKNCFYENELLLMLSNCRNLRDFSMEAACYNKPSIALYSCLAKNVYLSRVRVKVEIPESGSSSIDDDESMELYWISFIKYLFNQCSKLKTFVGEFDCTIRRNWKHADMCRLLRELGPRLHLQIKMRLGDVGVLAAYTLMRFPKRASHSISTDSKLFFGDQLL